MLQIAALAEMVLCWIVWSLAFVRPRKQAINENKVARATESRWGIFLVSVGIALVWIYVRPAGFHKSALELIVSMVLGPPSVALAWRSAHRLGKQWRFEAALGEGHELIQEGPYRWVRHPIYTSMFGMLTATGAAWTWWPMWIAATITFLIGTEIRVRAEDRLLEKRFQQSFRTYRAKVPAYLPLLR